MEKMVKNLETPWMSLRQRIQVRQNTIVALMEDQNDSAVGTLGKKCRMERCPDKITFN